MGRMTDFSEIDCVDYIKWSWPGERVTLVRSAALHVEVPTRVSNVHVSMFAASWLYVGCGF